MSWDPSLGETFTAGIASLVVAIGKIEAILKDILAELQAVDKKIK